MQQIGKYIVLGKIGAGGMGVVYKGYHPLMKRVVAIKTMAASWDTDPKLRSRFYREAQADAQLAHKNIVAVYDMGEEENRLYLVMEYLEGEDLRAKIARHEPPSLEEKLSLMLQVCDGLAHAHGKGITHRDIKPSNIFVTTAGEVKILDFGIARLETSDLTGTGEILGTPSYMPPEMLQKGKVDHRSDIYSAAVVFYEMFTCRRTFEAPQIHALAINILEFEPEPLDRIDVRIPRELSDIVRRAMTKDPARRYQSMEQVRTDLAGFQDSIDARKQALHAEARYYVESLTELVEGHADLTADARAAIAPLRARLGAPFSPPRDLQAGGTADMSSAPPYFDLCDLCNQARDEHGRVRALLDRRKHTVAVIEAAAALEKQGQLEEALTQVGQVLAEDPTFPSAVNLRSQVAAGLEERRSHEERRRRAEALYQEALRRHGLGDPAGCLRLLGSSLSAVPEHPEARDLLDRIRQAETPGSLAATLLLQARQARTREDFNAAIELITGAQLLRPENAEAVDLLRQIKQAAEGNARKEAAAKLLAHARELRDKKEIVQAATVAREALELFPRNPETQSLLREIEREIRAEEKRKDRQFRREAKERRRLHRVPGPVTSFIYALPMRLLGRAVAIRTLIRAALLILLFCGALILIFWSGSLSIFNTDERSAHVLFQEGNYEQADQAIGAWLGRDPGNKSARQMQDRARKGMDQLRAYTAALVENNYAKADGALAQIRQINPTDPNLPQYRLRLEEQFEASFGDEFSDLQGWLAPPTWEAVNRPNDRKLLVRAGLGLVRGRRYRDFDADFNITFGPGDTAAWILRAADERNCYLLQLNGPGANPPNSFLAFKIVQGRSIRLLPPVTAGKDLSRKDDQFHIIIKARGARIQHFIESGLAPEPGDPRELAPLMDAAFPAGAFGFRADGEASFLVRAFSIEPVRGNR